MMPVLSHFLGVLPYWFWMETVSLPFIGASSLVSLLRSLPRARWHLAITTCRCFSILAHLIATLRRPGLMGMRSLIRLPNTKSLLDLEVSGSSQFRWASWAALCSSVVPEHPLSCLDGALR